MKIQQWFWELALLLWLYYIAKFQKCNRYLSKMPTIFSHIRTGPQKTQFASPEGKPGCRGGNLVPANITKLRNAVIPTKRSAWRDLRISFTAWSNSVRRPLDFARGDNLFTLPSPAVRPITARNVAPIFAERRSSVPANGAEGSCRCLHKNPCVTRIFRFRTINCSFYPILQIYLHFCNLSVYNFFKLCYHDTKV